MLLNLLSSLQRVALLLPLLLCFGVNLAPVTQAVWLTIPPSGTKCVSENIHPNVVVLADYYVLGAIETNVTIHEPATISVKVTSPYGNNLHHQENATHGQFAFTTSEGGDYLACFWMDSKPGHNEPITMILNWKIGIAAKDWESVARKEKIEGVALELVKLEGQVQDIHANIAYLKEREAEMREVSEKTNARVAWYSMMSLGVCIITSACQLWYLKRFFRKKKLI